MRSALPLLATVPLGGALLAQQPVLTPVVRAGDLVPGVGLVTSIDNLVVADGGLWIVEADTDHPDTARDTVLLRPAGPYLREGDPLARPAGANIDSFDALTLNRWGQSGWNFFLGGTSGTNDDSGVFLDADLVIQEGYVSTSPSFGAGTPYIGFFETKINDANEILVVASVDDPNIASSVDRALVVLQVGATQVFETVVAKEGDVLFGQVESVADFGTGPHQFAFNNAGQVLFFADLNGDTARDGTVWLDATLLAQEGSPAPVAGRNWENLASRPMDLNAAGGWVLRGDLDGGSGDDEVIVRNGAVLVREGDSLPDIAPFRLTGFGSGPVRIDDRGNVLWYGDWDDPDTSRDTGLFWNDRLIVQEGVTRVGGAILESLSGVQDGFSLSDDGRWFLFEGTLATGQNCAVLGRFSLFLSDPQPGVAGVRNTVTVEDAAPGARLYLVSGFTPGSTPVPSCPGLDVGIANPRLLATEYADPAGGASFSGRAPASLSGRTLLLQCVQPSTCELSNLVAALFQ